MVRSDRRVPARERHPRRLRPRGGPDGSSLSRTASGEVFPDATTRARRGLDLEDPFVGWSAAIGIALLGLFLRLWQLGEPKAFSFDETYYAKDAWSLLTTATPATTWRTPTSRSCPARPPTSGRTPRRSPCTPTSGKWLIALGEKAFGMDPFGWRVSAAVVGSLMILVMCRFVRRVTGSTLLGCVGGLLLGLDGLHLVLSRLALLDIFLAFFLLCAVHCLVADRDWFRRRLAATGRPRRRRATSRAAQPWGPVRGLLLPAVAAGRRASASGWPWARSGPRSTPWRRSGSWCGPGASAPDAPSGCGGRCSARRSSTACRRSCP